MTKKHFEEFKAETFTQLPEKNIVFQSSREEVSNFKDQIRNIKERDTDTIKFENMYKDPSTITKLK